MELNTFVINGLRACNLLATLPRRGFQRLAVSTTERDRTSCMKTMRVKLIRKYAESIDGVDISRRKVGDAFNLPQEQARLLVAEEWAVPVERRNEARPETDRGFFHFPL